MRERDDLPDLDDVPTNPRLYRRLPLLEAWLVEAVAPFLGWSGVPKFWGVEQLQSPAGHGVHGCVGRGRSGNPHVLINLSGLSGTCPIFRVGVARHELEHVVAGHVDRVDPASPLHRFTYDFDPEAGERRADEAGAATAHDVADFYNRHKRRPDALLLNPDGCRRCYLDSGDLAGGCRQPGCLADVQTRLKF